MPAAQRICSLLPSATEIVCALGMEDRLVAVTHECDYPPSIRNLPHITSSVVDPFKMSAGAIDAAIRRALENLSTIYYLNREMLDELQPDLILTQELCEVCAVSLDRVQAAASSMCPTAGILSLEPTTLEGIFDTIVQVGDAGGVAERATGLIGGLRWRCESVRQKAEGADRPRVLALEWLEPLFSAGHWVPDMIEIAGGECLLSPPGSRSRELSPEEIVDADPDIILLIPCGYNVDMALDNYIEWPPPDWLNSMRVSQNNDIIALDGSAYFNRPGPRVVDGIEMLARLFHPEQCGGRDPYDPVYFLGTADDDDSDWPEPELET